MDFDEYYIEPDPPRAATASVTRQGRRDPLPVKVSCARCGHDHVRSNGQRTCSAHRRGTDPLLPCLRIPRRGATVCANHGGDAPQVTQRGTARTVEAMLLRAVTAHLADKPTPVIGPEPKRKKGGHKKRPRTGVRATEDTTPQHGTRACWESGCARYECVTAADIDPVIVERRLHGEPWQHQRPKGMTADEREEYERRVRRQEGERERAVFPVQGTLRSEWMTTRAR